MSWTKCYSVIVDSLISISEKAYKVRTFDGSEDIIPKSQVFGEDTKFSSVKEAYWISAWILEKKKLLFSRKRVRWFDSNGKHSDIIISKHVPDRVEPTENNKIDSLKK